LREAGRIADCYIGKIPQEPDKQPEAEADDDDVIFLDDSGPSK
jgi:hypothetical protein